ncbi:unnamed protein product [Spodoptera littoralis]|uniref:N-acetyltransferase domain-containing protein n=1 Tax=Spodoptera littoralis TaxID=7109 RepID=A0A9P0NA58_SPOLI|nr:unnamed protein product [Spodoptera littoralis]
MSVVLKEWSKFSVAAKDGSVLNLRTVEILLNTSVMDNVLQCYLNYFVTEEANFIAARVLESEEAMDEMAQIVRSRSVLTDDEPHIVVCCFDNGNDDNIEVLGASIMALVRKDNPPPKQLELKSKECQKLMEIMGNLMEIYDEMKVFDLNLCFSDRGLVVCPEYRGLGIAQELLKVRRLMCKEYGIPVNGAWMTSYGTQKAAERDGWETVCELLYEDLEKKFHVIYPKNPPSTKFMIARISI